MFIEHSSDVSYDNEQYLVCTGEKHSMKDNSMDQSRSFVDDLSRIRTVEKSRLFNDKQQKIIQTKINRWERAENIPRYRCSSSEEEEERLSSDSVEDNLLDLLHNKDQS